jgi:arylsulfatase A-like enzyme
MHMAQKPNIVFIIADDLGYGDLSCQPTSAEDIHTPGIDRLAGRGALFTEAYTTSPICSPSRTGMITGKYQQRWGNYWFGQGGLPSAEMTIPKKLKEYGYRTKKVGKTHHNGGDAQHPLKHGFDEFYGFVDHSADYLRHTKEEVDKHGAKNAKLAHIGILERNGEPSYDEGYTTDLFTDEAIEFIRRDHGDTPFYLEISYNAVHQPIYVNHPDYLDRFGLKPFKLWEPDKEDYTTWHDRWGLLGEVDPDGRKRYLSTLAVLDDAVSKIVDVLGEKGIDENTVVVFVSDNGGAYENYAYNAALKSGKYTLFEGGIRVPLLVSWPKRWQGGRVLDGMVSTMDLFATLADAVGGVVPSALDGRSLAPMLEGKADGGTHETLVWDNGNAAKVGGFAVRKGDWKLVNHELPAFIMKKRMDAYCERENNYDRPSKEYNGLWFYDWTMDWQMGTRLYNLADDVTESRDLSSEHPEKVQELTEIYRQWRAQMIDPVNTRGK